MQVQFFTHSIKATLAVALVAGGSIMTLVAPALAVENTKPKLQYPWNSTFGKIHFYKGYYGNQEKRISGQLFKDANGRWTYSGRWSRASSSRTGNLLFVFSQNGFDFTGYFSNETGSRSPWTGQSILNETETGTLKGKIILKE